MLPGLPATALAPGLAPNAAPPSAEPGATASGGQAFSRLLGRLREAKPAAAEPAVKPEAADPAAASVDALPATPLPESTGSTESTEDWHSLPADVLAAMLAAPPGPPIDAPALVPAATVSPPPPAAAPVAVVADDAATAVVAAAATSRSAAPALNDAAGTAARATPASPAEPGSAAGLPAIPSPRHDTPHAAHSAREALRTALTPSGPELPAQALALGLRTPELRGTGPEPAARSTATGAVDAAGAFAALLSATPGLHDPGPTAATPAVQIAAAVETPEFAEQLGVQLSMLARDGVQHAELHLNPVEMGPVSVQIALDGAQARIEFGAEVAATRQAIEHSLPALASALRDAGLTLAGGAVSQHAGGQGGRQGASQGEGRDGGNARGAGADAPPGRAGAARRLVRAGGVDLYA